MRCDEVNIFWWCGWVRSLGGTAYQPRATPWDQKPRTFWRSEGTLQTRGSTDRPRRYAAFLQNAPDSGCLSPGFHPGLVYIAPLGQGGYPRVDRPCSVRISGWDLGLICYPIGAGGYIRRSIGRVVGLDGIRTVTAGEVEVGVMNVAAINRSLRGR